jgi:molybdenum cofactor cytidylyltransferase
MPAIREETIHNMTVVFKDRNIVIPTYQGKKGHPVMLDKIFIEQCLNEKKEKVLYEVIAKNSDRINFLPVEDKGILMDIDTMEDYEKLKKYYNDPMNK